MKSLIILLLSIVAAGCCTTTPFNKETRIRDTVITVQPAVVESTLPAIVTDTIVSAFMVKGKDTVVMVKYLPKQKTIYLRAQPDSVRIAQHDTLTVYKTVTQVTATPFLSKVGIWFFGFLVGVIILLMLMYYLRKKQ